MKVDNPVFDEENGSIDCIECPFASKIGIAEERFHYGAICWAIKHDKFPCGTGCPTRETYAEACALADAAAQEAK